MATKYWVSTDGNLTASTSWSDGLAPANGDTLIFDDSSQAVSSNLDPSITGVTWVITQNYRGQFGNSAADPVVLAGATSTDTVRFYGSSCPAAFIDSSGQENLINVFSTSNNANALVVTGDGDGYLNVVGGRRVTIDSGATLKVRQLGNSAIYNSSGSTISEWSQWNGIAENLGAITTINLWGGQFQHNGTSTNNITTINQHSGRFDLLQATGATITKLNAYGGVFDASRSGTVKTFTNADAFAGATLLLDNGADTLVTSNSIQNYGARIIAGPSVSVTDNLTMLSGGDAGNGVPF